MARMDKDLILLHSNSAVSVDWLPAIIADAGPTAAQRFLEFFAANIRNRGTREVYGRAVARFCRWCDMNRIALRDISPLAVSAYVEVLSNEVSKPTVKLHLAAIRMMFDWLVTGHVILVNPAASVRGPKYVVKKGKTPVLSAAEARELIRCIDTGSVVGLRDRALIGVMIYSFARVSAAIGMNLEDYFPQGRLMWLRLHEKVGKHHEVPAHHKIEQYVDEYIQRAGIAGDTGTPLFRTVDRRRRLTGRRMHRVDTLRMIKRPARVAGLPASVCCHTFRATGITVYLENSGQLEHAQRIAAHESIRTTKLYDRTGDAVSLDEIERIAI